MDFSVFVCLRCILKTQTSDEKNKKLPRDYENSLSLLSKVAENEYLCAFFFYKVTTKWMLYIAILKGIPKCQMNFGQVYLSVQSLNLQSKDYGITYE